MPNAELLSFLLAAAAKLSGYPEIPVAQLPPVRAVSVDTIAQAICPEQRSGCTGIAATFETESHVILIRDSLDLEDTADNSFLLHEFVHVLQWKAHGDAIFKDCPTTLKTEGEAYRAQNAYLKREGQFLRFGEMLAYTQCAEDTGALFPRDAMSTPDAGKPTGNPAVTPEMLGPLP